MRPRLSYGPDVICVVPIGSVLPELVERVVRLLREVLGLPVIVGSLGIDKANALIATRGQYDATRLLLELREHCSSQTVRVIGITESDLCNLILDFVYGEAQVDGNVAVCSTARLRDCGETAEEPEQLQDRLAKVVLHELGHVFGLGHCEQEACVMRQAWCVDDIDRKAATYCASCLGALSWEIRRRVRPASGETVSTSRAA